MRSSASSGGLRSRARAAAGFLRRGVMWGAIAASTLLMTILVTSTWQRHRPAEAEPLVVEVRDVFGIDVLNGNGRRGEARTVASLLRQAGFRVEEITNAERFDYPRTLVIDRAGRFERARSVAHALGGVPVVLQRGNTAASELTVVLGHDWSLDPSWEER